MQNFIFGSLFALAALKQVCAIPVGVENAADLPESVQISCAPGECSEEDMAALNAAADLLIPGTDGEFSDWSITSNVKPANERRDGAVTEEEMAAKVGEIQQCAQGDCTDEQRKALAEELRAAGSGKSIWDKFNFEYGLNYKIGKSRAPAPTPTPAPTTAAAAATDAPEA